jgi:ketosteroid isomerase-like protein
MNRRTSIITGVAAVATAAVALSSTSKANEAKTENPELEKIRTVLKAHDDAMTSHNFKGVQAVLAPKVVIMGTGPGEVWSTPEQIEEAYKNFFDGFDKGEQDFTYQVKHGGLSSDMGWLMVSGDVKGKKDGKDFAFPINISLTVAKVDGAWKIAAMHFSNLTGEGDS